MTDTITSTPETTLAITRPWSKIDPKVIVGAVSSITVGGVVTAAAALGVTLPQWVAVLIVIVAYAVASYLTKTRIPVADDSGLQEQQAIAAGEAALAGDELADGDLQRAAAAAFRAAGYTLDSAGNVTDAGPTEDEPKHLAS